ncbi:MAG TPA: response regulator [Gammaproteobacteria bacterium]
MTETMPAYLIVDDDGVFAAVLQRALRQRGYTALLASTMDEVLKLLQQYSIQRLILDLKLHRESGLDMLATLKRSYPEIEIVVLTGYSSIATAVEAIKLGAVHYLCKPADADEIIAAFTIESRADIPAQPPSVKRLEWEHIHAVLAQHAGNISASARSLGMHRRTLQRKLQKRPFGK